MAKTPTYRYLTVGGKVPEIALSIKEFPVGTLVRHIGYSAADLLNPFGENSLYGLLMRSLAQPPFLSAPPPLVRVAGAPRQPIFFNHVIHAGSFGIECQYCHADARRSEYAGLPSVIRCLGCHAIIGAQDNPEIRKIYEYASRREAIPWVRVFKVPEFTYFPHKPHVRAGVACQRCHGPIERMRVVGAETGQQLGNDLKRLIGLRPAPPPLTMGWCIDCHRAENAKGTKAPLDCVTCHH